MAQTELVPIDGIEVLMSVDKYTIIDNVRKSKLRGLPKIQDLPEFRNNTPIALVGGGHSLNDTYRALKEYRYVMACGSVHDHLVSLGITPRWCVVSDPDPIMARYLTKPEQSCKYLVATHCAPEVYKVLEGFNVTTWNCREEEFGQEVWGDTEELLIGGGCTVGTRALVIAMVFGFEHIHLYGFDNCIPDERHHHAYAFETEKETVGECTRIALEPDGPRFLMPGYLLAQLYDFKNILSRFPDRLRVKVFGGGAIAELLALAGRMRLAAQQGVE